MKTYRIMLKNGNTFDVVASYVNGDETFVRFLDQNRQTSHLFASDEVRQVVCLGVKIEERLAA